MNMTIEDLNAILSGFVDAGMGDVEFKVAVKSEGYQACYLESVTVSRNAEGFMMPSFIGDVKGA